MNIIHSLLILIIQLIFFLFQIFQKLKFDLIVIFQISLFTFQPFNNLPKLLFIGSNLLPFLFIFDENDKLLLTPFKRLLQFFILLLNLLELFLIILLKFLSPLNINLKLVDKREVRDSDVTVVVLDIFIFDGMQLGNLFNLLYLLGLQLLNLLAPQLLHLCPQVLHLELVLAGQFPRFSLVFLFEVGAVFHLFELKSEFVVLLRSFLLLLLIF